MRNALSAALLLAALLPPAAAVPAAAQGRAESSTSDLFRYINGEGADPSCGICLKAANKYFDDERQKLLAKKTEGMVRIPEGRYKLGSPDGKGDPDEHPSEEIALDTYYIDKHEVTIKDYMDFTKATGSGFPEWAAPGSKYNLQTGKDKYYQRLKLLIDTCPSCPVFGVSWKNAADYCAWKNRRLPTEAEWETAASFGPRDMYGFANAREALEQAWMEDNSNKVPHAVGGRKPTRNGVYDMLGNVWEWVADFYVKDYYSLRPNANPAGPNAGTEHVIRGGSWSSDVTSVRIANRASSKTANDDIGFRCAVSETAVLSDRSSSDRINVKTRTIY